MANEISNLVQAQARLQGANPPVYIKNKGFAALPTRTAAGDYTFTLDAAQGSRQVMLTGQGTAAGSYAFGSVITETTTTIRVQTYAAAGGAAPALADVLFDILVLNFPSG